MVHNEVFHSTGVTKLGHLRTHIFIIEIFSVFFLNFGLFLLIFKSCTPSPHY